MNGTPFSFARRFDGVTGSAIREIFKLLARPGMISFAGGNPSPDALREDMIGDLASAVLQKDGKAILQYGATEGYPPLVSSLTAYINDHLSIRAEAANILPVTGSTQAMDLLLKALIDPGDAVLVEDPTFLGNMQCIKLYQAKIIPVPSDDDGILLSELERIVKLHKPKMLYIIPTFQNPTGRTLHPDRRQPIAEMAAAYRFVVAEDDPYRDLRYSGQTSPAIKTYDTTGYTAYLGSFSKTVSPGMRVGFIAAHEALIRKCTIGKQSSDLHTPNLTQAIVDLFLRENLLPAHIETLRGGYRAQMDTMLEALESFPSGTTYTRPQGGLFIFVTLPDGIDAVKLLKVCVERGVAYVPGTYFYADGGHENTLRLNFSNSTAERIQTGMAILRQTIEEATEGR